MSHPLINAQRIVFSVAALVSLIVLAPWASAGNAARTAGAAVAAPANDNFEAAQVLFGESGDVVATSKDATKEAGEPAHAGDAGGASVWFRWTAARSGTLTVWVGRPPGFDTVLGVYTGSSVDALTEIASNDDYGPSVGSQVTLPVISGTEYRIAVDGATGANGLFRLRWRQGPENDNFADAEAISGVSGSVEGSSFGATPEVGEAIELSGASSWYRWTAPESGTFGFHVQSSRGLTVYSGSAIGALTPVGETGYVVSFPAVAGTEYSIRIAGWNWNDDYPFALHWDAAPANDAFSSAAVIEGPNGSVSGSTVFGSVESGEASGFSSVWYSWTAPTTGYVRFDAWQLNDPLWWLDSILTVYRGETVDSLAVVARNDDWYWTRLPDYGSALSFRAVAGTTYSISVAAYGSYEWGPFSMRWYPGAIIFGKSGNNNITGTPGRDYLNGMGGDDVIHGLAGQDVVVGGHGRDRLFGDAGADALNSRDWVRGNDVLYGGVGTDSAVRDRRDELHSVP
jgi:Ca2+-binding RTX toxin-like protein